MTLRNASLLLAVLSLLLASCGGGGSSGDAVVDDFNFNASEKSLVGSYALTDFHVWEAGTAPRDPKDFEAWAGTMELRADRTATVALELCEHATEVTAGCEREFVWSADAGTIHLLSLDPVQCDIRVEWENAGMGAMTTHSLLPTNDPGAGLLLFEDGYETLHWTRME